jgi:hypothetical protein
MKAYDDRCKDLFSCVLQNGASNLRMVPDFLILGTKGLFNDIWGDLFRIIAEYFKITEGGVIGSDEFMDFIDSAGDLSDEKRSAYEATFAELLDRHVNPSAFRYYVTRLLDLFKFSQGSKILSNAQVVLQSQLTIGKKTYEGYEGMRDIVLKGIYDIDRVTVPTVTDGNVMEEAQKIMEEYASLKCCQDNAATGFTRIDKCTGGMHPGELWLWIGFTGEGKTFSCINIAYHVAFKQRKNVLFLTSETVRSVVRRRLISRHARELYKEGINLTAWKKGELDPESLKRLQDTLNDMETRKGEYGRFELLQMPSGATTDFVSASLASYQSSFNIDLCILDSIHLLQPKKPRQSSYAELDDMLIDIKSIIVSHNSGKGIPLISPWHVNRSSWEKAKEDGRYTKSSLAKTSEAERQADVIVSILKEENGWRELKGAIIKNRDGEELEEFSLACDLSHGFIGNQVKTNLEDDFKLLEVS